MELFLIRHGRSTWNLEGRVQGHRNPPLSKEGRLSAVELARHLLHQFGPFQKKKHVLVSSPLLRASETAWIISRSTRLPVVRRPNLKEANLGEWEGLKVDDIRMTDRRRLDQWYRDPTRVRLKGGEPILAFQKRVQKEMSELLYIYGEADRILVVTHGGWISALLTGVVGIPIRRMWTFVLDNCSLSLVHWDGRKLYLRSFNESSRSLQSEFLDHPS